MLNRFIEMLKTKHNIQSEQPLPIKNVILTQKELVRKGYPHLPLSFIEFLSMCNGITAEDAAVLGIATDNSRNIDIIAYNKIFNQTDDKVILGYDDFSFLVYDHVKKLYLIIDRDNNMVLEEFAEDELIYALNSILHV